MQLNVTFSRRTQSLQGTLTAAVWRQWAELGASAAVGRGEHTSCVIDPEALILATLWLSEGEARLADLMIDWMQLNGQFVSVQRIRNIASAYPLVVLEHLSQFARVMVDHVKDARWKPLCTDAGALPHRRNKIRSVTVALDKPVALLLRLRGLFGLGVRADVITFLLSKADHQDYVDAGDVAEATGYTRLAVKRVLDMLVAAQGLSVIEERDPGYSIAGGSLRTVLGSDPEHFPRWMYCHQTFAATIDYLSEKNIQLQTSSHFLRSVATRRFIDKHRYVLLANGLLKHHELNKVDDMSVVANRLEHTLGTRF